VHHHKFEGPTQEVDMELLDELPQWLQVGGCIASCCRLPPRLPK
jgi:hypothetical protein